MKKTLLVAFSFLVATVSFSTNSGSSTASAPAASSTIENKAGVSASFNEFSQLPEAPSATSSISEKLSTSSLSEMTKAEKKEIKSEIKSAKEELKAQEGKGWPKILLAFLAWILGVILAVITLSFIIAAIFYLLGLVLFVWGILELLGVA